MIRSRLLIATLALALAPCTLARAQVSIDVTKITCDQFRLYKITDPQNIAIWLSGYYHGKQNTTVVDTQALQANMKKIMDYCLYNPNETVWHAVETIFGPLK
jgi:acid stress chaperone HdeB